MKISDAPLNQRPREKLLQQGAQSLSDAELLAIFLRTGIPGKSAIHLAHELLTKTGGFRQLLGLPLSSFQSYKGLGTAKFAQIHAAIEMTHRFVEQSIYKESFLESPQATKKYLLYKLKNSANEQFCCIFLDNKPQVIAFEPLFFGTINSASVYPRVVVQRSLYHNAAALIFAHNHPSGDATASQADIEITKTLKSALSLIDIRVLDHFIVADKQLNSMAEQGLV
ncbi:MAG: DNA repair protein RadC [Kangiellaceae bacterium]|jgi:DNA repair protein RadC|nr:DNA repair protein RadC [Kangiellaceae bacterium]